MLEKHGESETILSSQHDKTQYEEKPQYTKDFFNRKNANIAKGVMFGNKISVKAGKKPWSQQKLRLRKKRQKRRQYRKAQPGYGKQKKK